jgi:hypothetical protein
VVKILLWPRSANPISGCLLGLVTDVRLSDVAGTFQRGRYFSRFCARGRAHSGSGFKARISFAANSLPARHEWGKSRNDAVEFREERATGCFVETIQPTRTLPPQHRRCGIFVDIPSSSGAHTKLCRICDKVSYELMKLRVQWANTIYKDVAPTVLVFLDLIISTEQPARSTRTN